MEPDPIASGGGGQVCLYSGWDGVSVMFEPTLCGAQVFVGRLPRIGTSAPQTSLPLNRYSLADSARKRYAATEAIMRVVALVRDRQRRGDWVTGCVLENDQTCAQMYTCTVCRLLLRK